MMSLKARRRELRANGFWVNFLGIIPLVWGCLLLFLLHLLVPLIPDPPSGSGGGSVTKLCPTLLTT